jgi:hypothetical protein
MKKYFFSAVCILFIALPVFAIKVPKAVKDAFEKKFPAATNVSWAKENAKEYEANFKLNGTAMSANFLSNGNWKETETEITIAGLPAAVSDAIKSSYKGYSITGADKIETAEGAISFEADIKLGKKKKEVLYKPDGTVIK